VAVFSEGMVKHGHYVYMDHLRILDSLRPRAGEIPVISWTIHTPLCLKQWEVDLADHPDSACATYILNGIHKGFRIGFDRRLGLTSSDANLKCDSPSKVTEYLAREVLLHRMWKCPVGTSPKGIHLSPLGLIPKKNKPGKWRMIVDLSSPKGSSVNDGISTELASLQYASIDNLAALVIAVGRNSFLVKADIKEAYRMIPVHL